MRKPVLILILSLVLMGMVVPNAMADDRPYEHVHMTLVIFRLVVIPDPDYPVEPEEPWGEADLVIVVDGPNGTEMSGIYHNDNDIQPFWTRSWVIPTADYPEREVPIFIQISEDDQEYGDDPYTDIIDLNPEDFIPWIEISVNLDTGQWTGDTTTGYSMGDGDTEWFYDMEGGGQQTAIFFGVTLSPTADTDGDGIPDYIELHGIDYLDDDNVIQTDTAIVCDPCRESIAVQIDYMAGDDHTHQPVDAAIDEAVEMFNNAPRSAVTGSTCPYEGYPLHDTGIDLLIDIAENPLAVEFPVVCDDFNWGVMEESFPFHRTPYYHHSVWAHNIADSASTGRSCIDPDFVGTTFLVTLGDTCDQEYCDNFPDYCDQYCDLGITQNGGTRLQSLTLVHELGHNLGLRHGGDVNDPRFKANYLSVMNYKWRNYGLIDVEGNTWIDYSKHELGSLDKRYLDEEIGIPGVLPEQTNWMTSWGDLNHNLVFGRIGGPLDWNNNSIIDEELVGVDIEGYPYNCICCGPNGILDSTPSGDDIVDIEDNCIRSGPNSYCESTAVPDDDPSYLHSGYDDWANIKFRAAMAPEADAPPVPPIEPHNEPSGEELGMQWSLTKQAFINYLTPDLQVTKSVNEPDALPGDILTYTVTIENNGTGLATSIELVDTMPNGTVLTKSLADLPAGASTTETLSFTVPVTVPDGQVLVNTATVTATNVRGEPESDTSNNYDQASTTVHKPVLTQAKAATASVNPGEAITYSITYENTGSADAEDVVITDTLPVNIYYSTALDTSTGPQPDAVASNPDGTTTLTWNIGPLTAGSESPTIAFTARPSLLFLGGETVTNDATLDFSDANGNDYPALAVSVPTTVTTVIPGQSPRGIGYFRNHPDVWTPEILAMIQATDMRYDTNTDGMLSPDEVRTILKPGGNQPKILQMQLLATEFNLATRQVGAGTVITSDLAVELGISDIFDAVVYAKETLAMPVNKEIRDRYSDATTVLDEINNGISEMY